MRERNVIASYRRLRAWVASERRRLASTGERPTQKFLRRARLVDDIAPITMRELVRELQAFARRRS